MSDCPRTRKRWKREASVNTSSDSWAPSFRAPASVDETSMTTSRSGSAAETSNRHANAVTDMGSGRV